MQYLAYIKFLISLWCISAIFSISLLGQNFEGEILFIKQSFKDTSYLSYKIKGNKVRLEELSNKQELESYMIIDLSKKTIQAISPKRKLYFDMPVYPWMGNKDTANFNIIQTGNYKLIKGYKCYQWRIQNKKEDTEVQFWTATEQFGFFLEFNKLLNRSEKITQYYLNAPQIDGQFPLELVERSMLREMRMRLEVVNIEKKIIQSALFEIPVGYKLFKNN